MRNSGAEPYYLAPWILTMMAQGGAGIHGFPPRGTHPEMLEPTNPLVMWAFTHLDDPRWRLSRKYLVLRQDPNNANPQKLGAYNRHTWGVKDRGIEGAIRDILQSARLGYCVIGSDVAGYHGRSNPDDIGPAPAALLGAWSGPASGAVAAPNQFGTAADNDIAPNVYIRWAEFSAFCGLFLNGGHGERRLWKRSWPELDIIRKFSWVHTELVPYMYSYVVECHNGAPPLMRPPVNPPP